MVHSMFDITGKKAIVTGGTRGLGFGMAEGLAEAGCEVCIVGTSPASVDAALEKLSAQGLPCAGVSGDLSRREEVYRVFNDALSALGGDLDIMVVSHGIQRRRSAEEFSLTDWDDVINVNLNSVFILDQEAAKVMLPKGYGKIINIASMCSFFGGQTIPAYSAAKGGVAQLTKELSNDWLRRGINVNAIAPGYMDTDMNIMLMEAHNPERYRQITDRIPAGRWGTGEDMKGTCIFLASRASDYLGGAIIPVDGGYLVK